MQHYHKYSPLVNRRERSEPRMQTVTMLGSLASGHVDQNESSKLLLVE